MLSSKRIYRSLADSRLLITEDQAVLTIVSESNKFPYKAGLYIEMMSQENMSSNAYQMFYISQYSLAEYGDPSRYRPSTQYNIEGPGIHLCTISHSVLSVPNSWCYIKPITKEMGEKIYEIAYEISSSLKNNKKYSEMNSLDFYKTLLTEAKLIENPTELELKYISQKQYEPTEFTTKIWQTYKGNYINPAIDEKSENKITSELLTFKPTEETYTSLESKRTNENVIEHKTQEASLKLHSIFNLHQQKQLKINWDSELGRRIQFIQDKLGIYLFCYEQLLCNALGKTTKLPTSLIKEICNYTENDYNRLLRIKTPSQSTDENLGRIQRCVIL